MYTIEDFRHAPMRVLGIADTAEEIPAVIKALGIEGRAFVSAGRQASIEETFERADEHPQLVLDLEDADSAREEVEIEKRRAEDELRRVEERLEEVEIEKRRAEDELRRVEERLEEVVSEAAKLNTKVRQLEAAAQPALPQPAATPAPTAAPAKRSRKAVA